MTGQSAVNFTHYRVLYADVDSMEVMYYGRYFRLFERGRGELIRDRGMSYREIEERGYMLPVTEANCHYNSSARYDDLVLIATRIELIRRASIRFGYKVFRDDSQAQRLAEGYTVHACLSPERKVVRIPDWLRTMLA